MIPKRTALIFIVLFLAVLACGPNDLLGSDENSRATYAAQTVAAYHAQNQSPPSDPQQPPPAQPTNTNPQQQPPAAQPTNTTPPTATTKPVSSTPCDKASLASETVPDGSKFSTGESFTKKWVIRNEGSCTWNSAYQWVFASGENMSGPTTKPLTTGTVPPGGTVEVSLDLTAPNTPGTYRGTYQIRNAGGQIFTTNGFWVEIKVEDVLGHPQPPVPHIDFFFTMTVDSSLTVDLDTATVTSVGADFRYFIDAANDEFIEPYNSAEFFYWTGGGAPSFNDCISGPLDTWPIIIYDPGDIGEYFCFFTTDSQMGYLQIDGFSPTSMTFTYGIWITN